ncbi:MAG TPA: TonB family protein [Bacteroidales bacterium]|nr:TonB family protein [Bacteroidales bacterium]
MKRKNEKVPGFDEIIFENRNKEYGAYDLRKKYKQAASWSVIGGAVLFSGLILSIFLGSESETRAGRTDVFIVAKFDKDITDPNKIIPETPKLPKLKVEIPPYVAPIIVDKVDSGQKNMIANATLDTMQVNRPVSDTGVVIVKDPTGIVPDEPEPVYVTQEMPMFPGGPEAITEFIGNNLKYPEKALETNIEGKVIVRFVVSSDGSVKRVSILRGVDPLLDAEASRVVAMLPKWKPGKNNGTPVSVWFCLPVTFRITRN